MSSAVCSPVSRGVLVATPSMKFRDRVLSLLDEPRGPVQVAAGGAEALDKLERGDWQTLILDRDLPDLDAEELVSIIGRRYPELHVVLLDGSADDVAKSLLPWPVNFRSVRQSQSVAGGSEEALPGMIGDSEAMREVYRMVRLVARRNTTVLITGPTGSGKELVARAIHQLSGRALKAFAVLNCAALPDGLIESELFGYSRGAFTGAVQNYRGRLLSAQGGTLFLDEIGELPLGAQSKLLRFLEQKEIQRLGSAETTKVDVRVVAATNRDLERSVTEGRFRDDLYFRLSAFPIAVPALADRRMDVVNMARHFLKSGADDTGTRLSEQAAEVLVAHSWPGNVRELQQVLERAVILADGETTILPCHLRFNGRRGPVTSGDDARAFPAMTT